MEDYFPTLASSIFNYCNSDKIEIDIKESSLEDVSYEAEMFVILTYYLYKINKIIFFDIIQPMVETISNQLLINIMLTSWTVHFRNIFDFLTLPNYDEKNQKDKAKKEDDVIALDYLSKEEWNEHRLELLTQKEELTNKINKLTSHITTERAKRRLNFIQNWDIYKDYLPLATNYNLFIDCFQQTEYKGKLRKMPIDQNSFEDFIETVPKQYKLNKELFDLIIQDNFNDEE